jgi:flagellar biosynthesis component FlhA
MRMLMILCSMLVSVSVYADTPESPFENMHLMYQPILIAAAEEESSEPESDEQQTEEKTSEEGSSDSEEEEPDCE